MWIRFARQSQQRHYFIDISYFLIAYSSYQRQSWNSAAQLSYEASVQPRPRAFQNCPIALFPYGEFREYKTAQQQRVNIPLVELQFFGCPHVAHCFHRACCDLKGYMDRTEAHGRPLLTYVLLVCGILERIWIDACCVMEKSLEQ